MEQVATQVTDLRYLAEVPVPLPATDSAATFDGQSQTPQPQHSPDSASLGDNSANLNPNKRKSFDDGGSARQTRSKRNRVSSCPFLPFPALPCPSLLFPALPAIVREIDSLPASASIWVRHTYR